MEIPNSSQLDSHIWNQFIYFIMHLPEFANIELALTIFLHSNGKSVNPLNASIWTLFNESILLCAKFSQIKPIVIFKTSS